MDLKGLSVVILKEGKLIRQSLFIYLFMLKLEWGEEEYELSLIQKRNNFTYELLKYEDIVIRRNLSIIDRSRG